MIKKLLFIIFFVSLCVLANPMPGRAYSPFNGVDCSGASAQSAVCNACTDAQGKSTSCNDKNSSDPVSGSDGLLVKITKIIAFAAGAAAIILIIVGSIRYVTSGGDAGNAKRARDTVLSALIGLAVIVLARTLILFVLSKL